MSKFLHEDAKRRQRRRRQSYGSTLCFLKTAELKVVKYNVQVWGPFLIYIPPLSGRPKQKK